MIAEQPPYLVPPKRARELAAAMRRYCRMNRKLKANPMAGKGWPELWDLADSLRQAGVNPDELVGVSWRKADLAMTDAQLLARAGLKVGR